VFFVHFDRLFSLLLQKQMPILLDLFSGSLSWTKAFAELPEWECVSIDNDPKYTDTTIICDVLEWEVVEQ